MSEPSVRLEYEPLDAVKMPEPVQLLKTIRSIHLDENFGVCATSERLKICRWSVPQFPQSAFGLADLEIFRDILPDFAVVQAVRPGVVRIYR